MAFVSHSRRTPCAGQDAEQGHLGQAHGAGTVIHQDDFVTSQGHLVTAASASAVHGQEFQAAVRGGVFQAIALLFVNLRKLTFQA